MKIKIIFILQIILPLSVTIMRQREDITTSYCRPGLCTDIGVEGQHSACKDGLLHPDKYQSPPCPKNAAVITLTDEDKQAILDYHNEQRNFVACGGLYKQYRLEPGCRHGVVTWDKDLEQIALLHTSYCLFDYDKKCSGMVKSTFPDQNTAMLTFNTKPENTSLYIAVIPYVWYIGYHYNTKMDTINSFFNQTNWMVDHFLISINERNNRVGCIFARFFDEKRQINSLMLSCNYPAANNEEKFIYNSCKRPATKCITGTDQKYKFLCSSKETYDVSGLLEHIPYDGDGTEVFDCGKQAELYYSNHKGADIFKTLHNTYPDFPMLVRRKRGDDNSEFCDRELCEIVGGEHSGCKGGIPHNNQFQHPPCPDDAAFIPLTEEDKQLIVDIHNQQRNFVACGGLFKGYRIGPGCRVGLVTWDADLEKTSLFHATFCVFAHDKCRGTKKFPFSGQNLGELTVGVKGQQSNTYYINAITYLWYVEYLDTPAEYLDHFPPDVTKQVGHFLTSLNERNYRIGCTFVKFSGKDNKGTVMLSCNYPTTNIGGTALINRCKNPGSKCLTGTDSKYKFLCSSTEEYDVSGLLEHTPYDGTGNEVFHCGKLVEFKHYAREGGKDVKILHGMFHPNNPIPEDVGDDDDNVVSPQNPQSPQSSQSSQGSQNSQSSQSSQNPENPETHEKSETPAAECYEGNPAAGGVPDYSESEYDPCDSSSVKLWQNCLMLSIWSPYNLVNLYDILNYILLI